MKTRKEIQAEVETTLNLVSEIAPVAPSSELKGRILDRLAMREPQVIPLYRKPVFVAAAAVVVLALNVLTVVYFLRQDPQQAPTEVPTDRLAEIQSAYSLDESIY